jgi:serine/threonine protein phosphatase 1
MLWIREPFIYSNFPWEKQVIFGHSAHKEPVVMDNKIGIDTMWHNHGKLTAVELFDDRTHKFYFQPSREGPYE